MKPSGALVMVCLMAGCAGSAQRHGSKAPQPPPPNNMTLSQAASLASHLTVGMPEAEAKSYLERHGFRRSDCALGTSFQWSVIFPLTNNCALALEIDAKQPGDFGAGVLHGANMQSNGVIVGSVKLSSAP